MLNRNNIKEDSVTIEITQGNVQAIQRVHIRRRHALLDEVGSNIDDLLVIDVCYR